MGVVYRSTASSEENNGRLLEMMRAAVEAAGGNHLLLMGDFNYPQLGEEKAGERVNTAAEQFREATRDLYLVQHIGDHTRVRQSQRPSKLDLVFTLDENVVQDICFQDPLGKWPCHRGLQV